MDKRYYKLIDDKMVFFKNPLIHDGMQVFNPTEEMLFAEGWQEYTPPTPPAPTPAQLLQEAKDAKIAEINVYDESDNVNCIIVNGIRLWIPAEQRAILKTSVEAYKALGIDTISKVWEGLEYTASADSWLYMINTVEVYASECFNTTARHINAVNSLSTIQDVEDYDYTLNYPAIPEFTI